MWQFFGDTWGWWWGWWGSAYDRDGVSAAVVIWFFGISDQWNKMRRLLLPTLHTLKREDKKTKRQYLDDNTENILHIEQRRDPKRRRRRMMNIERKGSKMGTFGMKIRFQSVWCNQHFYHHKCICKQVLLPTLDLWNYAHILFGASTPTEWKVFTKNGVDCDKSVKSLRILQIKIEICYTRLWRRCTCKKYKTLKIRSWRVPGPVTI